MKKITSKSILGAVVCLTLNVSSLHAKVSQAEADKLGNELTPMGAVKAANADGSIPAWSGGIQQPPAGYKTGDHHPDPFSTDKVQFTITAENASEYKDNLTPGQLALFKTYPETFKMKVYQSRRTAAYPSHVYDAVKANAPRAELIADGNGLKGASVGVPFPIPQTGLEVIWNHIVRYRGENVLLSGGQAVPTRTGAYTFIQLKNQVSFLYNKKGATPESLEAKNLLFYFKQWITSPARLAGTALMVHETIDQIKKPRQAWTYNTGQRRVRRAPNVAYDAPGTAADGLRTTDDFDMFNGAPNRYDWKLKGKKEIYIAYNNYQLHSDKLKYDDIIKPGHINQEHVRWEKHRVWVVEANLKQGTRHIYNKREFYIDEDSWSIAEANAYNDNGQLWRVMQAHQINYYEVPAIWSTLDSFYDLLSGRYLVIGLDNEGPMYDFNADLPASKFTPAALRRQGKR